MTIEIQGFVQALELAGEDVLVKITCETSRIPLGGPNRDRQVYFLVKPAEVAEYRPGTSVTIQVRPNAVPNRGTTE